MPTFKLTMRTDNPAFEGDPGREISRILREVAGAVEDGRRSGTCRDANGNAVGQFECGTDRPASWADDG